MAARRYERERWTFEQSEAAKAEAFDRRAAARNKRRENADWENAEHVVARSKHYADHVAAGVRAIYAHPRLDGFARTVAASSLLRDAGLSASGVSDFVSQMRSALNPPEAAYGHFHVRPDAGARGVLLRPRPPGAPAGSSIYVRAGREGAVERFEEEEDALEAEEVARERGQEEFILGPEVVAANALRPAGLKVQDYYEAMERLPHNARGNALHRLTVALGKVSSDYAVGTFLRFLAEVVGRQSEPGNPPLPRLDDPAGLAILMNTAAGHAIDDIVTRRAARAAAKAARERAAGVEIVPNA
jgi:hypothetical protein